jgi:hypothetical protein
LGPSFAKTKDKIKNQDFKKYIRIKGIKLVFSPKLIFMGVSLVILDLLTKLH